MEIARPAERRSPRPTQMIFMVTTAAPAFTSGDRRSPTPAAPARAGAHCGSTRPRACSPTARWRLPPSLAWAHPREYRQATAACASDRTGLFHFAADDASAVSRGRRRAKVQTVQRASGSPRTRESTLISIRWSARAASIVFDDRARHADPIEGPVQRAGRRYAADDTAGVRRARPDRHAGRVFLDRQGAAGDRSRERRDPHAGCARRRDRAGRARRRLHPRARAGAGRRSKRSGCRRARTTNASALAWKPSSS